MFARVIIRPEEPADEANISTVITRAFSVAEHADGNEAEIVAALRSRNELAVSLVAELRGQIVGHASASPVRMSDRSPGWFGLAPVSVLPVFQGKGIGKKLVKAVLDQLRESSGCVVLGDPLYYRQFGFANLPGVQLPGVPAEYFMALPLGGAAPIEAVTVEFSPAFDQPVSSAVSPGDGATGSATSAP